MKTGELSKEECLEIDGGIICGGLCLTLIGAAVGILLTQDLDDLGDAFMEGFEAGRN